MATKNVFAVAAVCAMVACAGHLAYAEQAAGKDGRLLTIQEGISIVQKDSRLVKISSFDNDMAFQDSMIARSVLLPHLNIGAAQTFNNNKPEMKFGGMVVPTSDQNPYSFGANVYQTLFDFGKSLSNYHASKEMVEAVKARSESVKRVATLEFVVAYFNLLEAEKFINVAEKEVESLTSYIKDMEHLFEQGVIVKNDLLPAKVKLADAKQKLIAARNGKEVAAARLNNILALSLREKLIAQDINMQLPQFPEIEDAWITAQEQRPEIVFYESRIKASVSSEKAKAVENLPVLYADGGYNHTKNRYQVHEDNMSVNLGVKMNLYDGGAARADLLKERALQKQIKEQKDKLIEDIKFEVENSHLSLKDACEKVSVASEALEQAGENVRAYRVKYTAGAATSTDVLEAITLQTRAQTNYYGADYELKRNYAKLMYSMGIDLALIYETMENKNEPEKR
ncbi:MAG: TolC family protein [Candidatus Omnitrophica bacterium]|nr:TolC family protein [Candidatus Omnitrophota bacterium]